MFVVVQKPPQRVSFFSLAAGTRLEALEHPRTHAQRPERNDKYSQSPIASGSCNKHQAEHQHGHMIKLITKDILESHTDVRVEGWDSSLASAE